MASAGETLAQVAAAVSGPDTPTTATVSRRPAAGAVWTLFVGLAVVCGIGILIIAILTWVNWPAYTARDRIHWLGIMGCISLGCVPMFGFAIVSPWVGKVDASAGAAHIGISRD